MEKRFLIRLEIIRLEKKAAWNDIIHCPFVAAKYRRWIERLEEQLKLLEEENR